MELIESLRTQLIAEVEEQELNPKELNILAQKYGLKVPQLIQSEKNLILKEERGRK